MKEEIIIRPRGISYILILVAEFIAIGWMPIAMVWEWMDGFSWRVAVYFLPTILIVLQVREIILYKIRLSKENIYLAANRELYLVRHKALTISYKGLESVQYHLGYGTINSGFLKSEIILTYENGKKRYLNVLRFNRKQIDKIKKIIAQYATQFNSWEVEIKTDIIEVK